VLPFANLSGDPGQDYFADGITENLTTDLSRIRNSFVIARNTAFTFKGKTIDSKEISKELGVRYVLEGSVLRDQNRVRVNAQLIDGETGAHLWAGRFEESITDLFKLQDQVVARLANTLGNELVKAEAQRSTHSTNPDAIDLTMRGLAILSSAPTVDQNHLARALLEQALNIDPNDARALTGNSLTYLWEYIFYKNSETDYDAKILGQADRAIALDGDYMSAYVAKGAYLSISGRPAEAVRIADAGLAIDPNAARLYAIRGIAEVYLSKFDQGKTDVQQAMRLSPRDPQLGMWHNFLANAERGLGHLDAAIDETKKAIAGGYRTFYAYLDLAAALALKGDIDDAKAALVEARRLNPGLSVKWLRERIPVLESAFDELRKAGLPEE
jgi:TolB-like protein